jgi:hypothetical protein
VGLRHQFMYTFTGYVKKFLTLIKKTYMLGFWTILKNLWLLESLIILLTHWVWKTYIKSL